MVSQLALFQDPIFDYEPYYKVDFKCNKIDDDENACSRADGFKVKENVGLGI